MKTIIAGSRNITDIRHVFSAARNCGWEITSVVSGCARGVDSLGEIWALRNNITVYPFPAEWGKYGKSAGYRRNHEMANNAEALIAIWDGVSMGTKHMIELAQELGLRVYVHRV